MNIYQYASFGVLGIILAISSSFSNAQIPVTVTTDFPAFVNQAEQMAQWAKQLKGMEEQFKQTEKQFKETKSLVTGNSNLGKLFNASDLVDYLPTDTSNDSWSSIYTKMDKSTLKNLRAKYGMTSKNQIQQEAYDSDLTNLDTLQKTYAASNKRLENIKNLQALADTAQTPQEKQDILSRIGLEQAAIQNDKNRMDTSAELMSHNAKLVARKQNQGFDDFLAGE